MPRLQSLKPRVGTLTNTKVSTLKGRPETVERKRGTTGINDRKRIKERDGWLCQNCQRNGRTSVGHEVDHIIPLWKGGTDDDDNKELLCRECHKTKSAREAAERAGGG
jgi:5-methylcytosine-specific restriction protein A